MFHVKHSRAILGGGVFGTIAWRTPRWITALHDGPPENDYGDRSFT